jgi:hypothetical protein
MSEEHDSAIAQRRKTFGGREDEKKNEVVWNKTKNSAEELMKAQPLNPYVPLRFKPLRDEAISLPPSGEAPGEQPASVKV